jgi:Cu/Ag efflux protein CusF
MPGTPARLRFDIFTVFLQLSGNSPQKEAAQSGDNQRGTSMRTLFAAIVATFAVGAAAFAAEAEGQIKKIDTDKLTITLDNGKSYKLPGEFDISSLKEGMEVLIAYDQVGGENLITDMELPE